MNKRFIWLMMSLDLTVSVTTVGIAQKSTSTCDNKILFLCTELAVYTNNGEENIVTEAVKIAGEKISCLTTKAISYDGVYEGAMGSFY